MTRLTRSALTLIWVHMIGTAERQSLRIFMNIYASKPLRRPLTVAAGGNSIIPQPSQFVKHFVFGIFNNFLSRNLWILTIDNAQ